MLHKTKIGVCMDYSIAYLLEEKNEEKVITIIEADIEQKPTNDVIHKKDHVFFKRIFEMIKDFDKVSLFGPEAVKKEILNRISANKLLNIEIQNHFSKDKITENQKINFINEYFET